MGLEFADVFVETGFVAHMSTAKLQYALAAESIFEAFLAHATLHVNVGAFPPGPRPLYIHNPRHTSGSARRRLRVESVTAGAKELVVARR